MNGVETCPWFGTRQHCQMEKDPIFFLAMGKTTSAPRISMCNRGNSWIWSLPNFSTTDLPSSRDKWRYIILFEWTKKKKKKTSFLRGQSWSIKKNVKQRKLHILGDQVTKPGSPQNTTQLQPASKTVKNVLGKKNIENPKSNTQTMGHMIQLICGPSCLVELHC